MADRYTIKMPQLTDTMTEGVLVSWEKSIGDSVARGDIVATIETDKAIMDVEVFRDGFLSGPMVEVDSVIPVGEPIAFIVETEAEIDHSGEMANVVVEAVSQEPLPTPAFEPAAPDAPTFNEPEGVVTVIKMPQLTDTMTEGVLVSWEKSPGDSIERGDIVATVETDKAIMDVEVFRDGFLSGPMTEVDAVVPVGLPIAYVVESADQVVTDTLTHDVAAVEVSASESVSREPVAVPPLPTAISSATGEPAQRPVGKQATPFARQQAGNLQVNLNAIVGTGPQGVIIGSDVIRAPAMTAESTSSGINEVAVAGNGRKMTAMERAISQNMAGSLTMPTFRVTINAQPAALIRAAKKAGVSVTVAIAKACAEAIKDHPSINWAYQPTDRLIERSQVDIGMAVAADDGGLMVPVLRDCGNLDVETLNKDWRALLDRARNRRLTPDEYANPTFMVSNMGMMGVSYFDAIPTPGIAAILAIAAVGEQGMPLTVSADHRVVNGAQVALYLNALKQLIEQPDSWLVPAGPAIPEGDWDYDVVVIGGGPGGEDCARDLAEHGMKVAMINDSPFPGGECLWRGCIPSKAWRAAADRMRDRAHDAHLGVTGTTEPVLDWSLLDKTRRNVLETRGSMALKTDTGVKIKVIQGYGSFVDDHHVIVDSSRNSTDPYARDLPDAGDTPIGEKISFGCAVIATGAPPFIPPIPGAMDGLGNGSVLTSDNVWGIDKVPAKMVVIGGGAIGVEMAQIFQDFGTEVTLLEAQDRILIEVENEIATQLTAILNDDPRLTVKTGVKIGEISGVGGATSVAYTDADGNSHNLDCDFVMMATGKRPKLDTIGIDAAKVAVDAGVIKVDTSGRTSIPHIFAVGDVIGGLMLAHTAGQQGRVAANTIMGEKARYDQDRDCGVIFTRPEAAFVGLSVAQAKDKGIDAVEVKVPMSIDAKAMIANEIHGLIKIVADKKSHRIIGVHLLADHADTLIGEAVMMVSGDMTLEQVANAIHPHPTQTELFGDMARRLLSRLRRSEKRAKK